MEHDTYSNLPEIAEDSRGDEDEASFATSRNTSNNRGRAPFSMAQQNREQDDDYKMVEFTGGAHMKSIIQFNHESEDLGLDSSEVLEAFEITKEITNTVRKELTRVE